MSIARIGKVFAAQNFSQVITVLTQLLLPAAFLHAYGVKLYGEWLALTAAITYLSTFNYGLQTYSNMQMTIHYNRGELQETREVQSAGLRILLAAVALVAAGSLVVFVVPLDSWLHLTIPQHQAQWTLYILGLQIMASMGLGFFSGSYMVIGVPHIGQNFSNATALIAMLGQLMMATLRTSFPVVAATQLTTTVAFTLFMIVDISRRAPDIRPTLRYWKPGSLTGTLKPSAHYALLYSSNILAYQIPTILMQRFLGPVTVVIYSVTRTVYSMSRRILYLITNSIGPEITITFGQRDWMKLRKLYEFSERVILVVTTPVTLGTMLATPLLLHLWLHKANLYVPSVAVLLGLTVSILGIKEHKSQFQFSSNQVETMSYAALIAYSLQLAVAVPSMLKFGLNGYLGACCLSELAMLFYLLHLNARLFGGQVKLDRKPVYELLAFMGIGSLALLWPLYHVTSQSYIVQALMAIGVFGISLVISYRLFKVDEVRSLLWTRISGKFALAGPRKVS